MNIIDLKNQECLSADHFKTEGPKYCEQCSRVITTSSRVVWLELALSGGYSLFALPIEDSQGWFPFHQACGMAALFQTARVLS